MASLKIQDMLTERCHSVTLTFSQQPLVDLKKADDGEVIRQDVFTHFDSPSVRAIIVWHYERGGIWTKLGVNELVEAQKRLYRPSEALTIIECLHAEYCIKPRSVRSFPFAEQIDRIVSFGLVYDLVAIRAKYEQVRIARSLGLTNTIITPSTARARRDDVRELREMYSSPRPSCLEDTLVAGRILTKSPGLRKEYVLRCLTCVTAAARARS